MVENPLSNAGDEGLIPGGGTKIPHAAVLLSPHATTREKPTRRNEEPTLQQKIPCAATKT